MPPVTPVGIDLGTSFCAVGYINADGQSQLIANEGGDLLTASVVYFADDQVQVGRDAAEALLHEPERVAVNAKRDMGAAAYRCQIAGQDYPPEVIQSCLLRQLRRDIVATVGDDYQAVITVPAYFDEARRKATFDAAIMSGIPLLDIVSEPTAAALSFGERLGYLTSEGSPAHRLNLLVYDLGGGTFDVTVIRLAPAEVRTLATDGDFELGGVNWDQRLAEHAESTFHSLWPDAAPLEQVDKLRLLRSARDAKHELTKIPAAVLNFNHDGKILRLPITRQEFEELTADLLERTAFTTKQAVQASGLLWNEIDRVLIVGGSSRMPAVARMLHRLSGIDPDLTVNPDEAVARGAAIFARYLLSIRGLATSAPALRITDVNSHALGIEGVNLQTLRAENVTLISRNTPLPCEVVRTFVTRANQPSVKVRLLEGESTLPEQCSQLAMATIKNLPPGLPQGTQIEVKYSLQTNGILSVTAAVPPHGQDVQIELQRVRGLADQRVHRWRKIVCQDGGYRDFHEAAAAFIDRDVQGELRLQSASNPSSEKPAQNRSLEPAVPFGAPQAAADALHNELAHYADMDDAPEDSDSVFDWNEGGDPTPARKPTPPRRPKRSIWVDLTGHVLAAIVGLAIGAYLLTLIRPDLNLLDFGRPAQDPDGKN